MQEENYKETNIILGILLTILIGINSIAILFIIMVAKVNAAGYVYYNNFSSIGAVNIGSRSEGTITQKTINQACNIGNSGTYCGYYANVNSRYMAIELIPSNEQMIANKYYTITVYYRIATSRNSNTGEWTLNQNYFDASSGVCTGWSATCFQTQNANATTVMNRLFTASMTLVGEYSNEYGYELQAVYASTIIIKANANGNIYLYLNSNNASNNIYLILFGAEINYYGEDINSAISNVATSTDITNSTNSINNNITSMRDSINQQTQQSTQEQINSQKVCENYNYNQNNVNKSDGFLQTNGTINTNWENLKHTTDYIPVNANKTYYLTLNYTLGSPAYCLYNTSKVLIECNSYNSAQVITITPNQEGFIRYSMSITNSQNTTFTGEYCKNGNQALMDGPGWNYTNPNSSAVDEEQSLSDQLDAFVVSDNDLNNLDIEMDITTSGQIWAIFTNLITGNALVYGTFLTILFLGVIKTMFAR